MAGGLLGVPGVLVVEPVGEEHRDQQEHALTLRPAVEVLPVQEEALNPENAMRIHVLVWQHSQS